MGRICFNKHENWSTKKRKGINADYIEVSGDHDPIISEELWNTVQAMHKTKSEKRASVFHGSFPFTGVMRCPMVGHGMVAIGSQPQITEDVVRELGQRQEVGKEPLEQELKHLDKELEDTQNGKAYDAVRKRYA